MAKKSKTKSLSLEEKFSKIRDEFYENTIKKHIETALSELEKAEKLSEENGIPFWSPISPLGRCYYPESVKKKLTELFPNTHPVDSVEFEDHEEELKEVIECNYGYGYGGWEHSMVC